MTAEVQAFSAVFMLVMVVKLRENLEKASSEEGSEAPKSSLFIFQR